MAMLLFADLCRGHTIATIDKAGSIVLSGAWVDECTAIGDVLFIDVDLRTTSGCMMEIKDVTTGGVIPNSCISHEVTIRCIKRSPDESGDDDDLDGLAEAERSALFGWIE